MSQENIELVRRCYAALDRRDWEGLWRKAHPDFELRTQLRGIPRSGRSATFIEDVTAAFESWEIVPERFFESDDQVVAFVVIGSTQGLHRRDQHQDRRRLDPSGMGRSSWSRPSPDEESPRSRRAVEKITGDRRLPRPDLLHHRFPFPRFRASSLNGASGFAFGSSPSASFPIARSRPCLGIASLEQPTPPPATTRCSGPSGRSCRGPTRPRPRHRRRKPRNSASTGCSPTSQRETVTRWTPTASAGNVEGVARREQLDDRVTPGRGELAVVHCPSSSLGGQVGRRRRDAPSRLRGRRCAPPGRMS